MEPKEIRAEERKQESAQRREKMVSAAYDCFCNQGIERTTIADIAGAAGFGEATLYRYFSTKENLALECGIRFWKKVWQFLQERTETEGYSEKSGMEQVEALAAGALEFYRQEQESFRLIYELDTFLMPTMAENEYFLAYGQAVDSPRQFLWTALEKGKADGSIRRKEEIRELYYALANGIFGMMQKQAAAGNLLATDRTVEPMKKTELMIALIIAGLRYQ